jgi:cytoskeleton protein RodZ
MPEQNSSLRFGHYLKSKREEAGLDLEYISMKTRIGTKILESIEKEDHAKLPEPVYVKGFIRAYAMVIGADGESIIHNYLESRRNYPGIKQSTAEFTKKRKKKRHNFWPRFIMGAMVMASLIAIVALTVSFYQGRFRSEPPELDDPAGKILNQDDDLSATLKISEQPEEINEEAIESLTEENAEEQEVTMPEKKPVMLNLSITATADTWMRVIIDGDGENKMDYSLKPGDKISLNASSNYNLLIGNAGGVQLNLNGQPVQIPGRMGQVVNLTLP